MRDLAKMKDDLRALVREVLGDEARVYVEITDPPRREVRIEVHRSSLDSEQVASWRGAPWEGN